MFYNEKAAVQRAVAAEREQLRLRRQAEADESKAKSEAAKSAQVTTFLEEMLRGVGPSVAKGRDTRVLREILEQTEKQLDALKDQPDVEADVRQTIGGVYRAIGEYKKAETMYRAVLMIRKKLSAGEDPSIATSTYELAAVLDSEGRYPEAEAMYREALAMRKRLFAEDSTSVAASLTGLAYLLARQGKQAEAESMCRQALSTQRKLLGPEHIQVASSLSTLAEILSYERDYAGAEAAFREALAIRRKRLGDEHTDVAAALNGLGKVLRQQGKLAEAEAMHADSLAMLRKLLGNEHRDVAASLNNLGIDQARQGELAKAEATYRESLAMSRKVFGDAHPDVAYALNNLAILHLCQGKLTEAEAMYRESLAVLKKVFGDAQPDIAFTLDYLARVLVLQGKLAEAEPMRRDALAMRRKLLGNEHIDNAFSLSNLANLLCGQGELAEAESMYREALEIRKRRLGSEAIVTLGSLNDLVDVLLLEGKADDAAAIFAEFLPPDEPTEKQSFALLRTRARFFVRVGRWQEAVADYVRCIDGSTDGPLFLASRKSVSRELAESDEIFNRIIKLRPEEATLWVGRGQNRSLQGRWAEAAVEYAKVIHDRPISDETVDYACLLVLLDDAKEYQQFCREFAARGEQPLNGFQAFILAWSCSAGSDSGIDPERLVRFAEQGLTDSRRAWRMNALGLAQYRAGRFESAIQSLQESNGLMWDRTETWIIRNPQQNSLNWLVMAMAHFRLAHIDEAKQCLETAKKLINLGRPKKPDEPAAFDAPADWIMANVLLREAETLLQSPVSKPTTPPVDH